MSKEGVWPEIAQTWNFLKTWKDADDAVASLDSEAAGSYGASVDHALNKFNEWKNECRDDVMPVTIQAEVARILVTASERYDHKAVTLTSSREIV